MNLIIKQALSDAHVLSKLEPSGLFRSDERRPDGVSLTPWRVGNSWLGMLLALISLLPPIDLSPQKHLVFLVHIHCSLLST